MQLPLYTCHKKVRAAKIIAIEYGVKTVSLVLEIGESIHLQTVTAEWMTRHRPQVGGYFVQYLEGDAVSYESYSPAAAFETGYTLEPMECVG